MDLKLLQDVFKLNVNVNVNVNIARRSLDISDPGPGSSRHAAFMPESR